MYSKWKLRTELAIWNLLFQVDAAKIETLKDKNVVTVQIPAVWIKFTMFSSPNYPVYCSVSNQNKHM